MGLIGSYFAPLHHPPGSKELFEDSLGIVETMQVSKGFFLGFFRFEIVLRRRTSCSGVFRRVFIALLDITHSPLSSDLTTFYGLIKTRIPEILKDRLIFKTCSRSCIEADSSFFYEKTFCISEKFSPCDRIASDWLATTHSIPEWW